VLERLHSTGPARGGKEGGDWSRQREGPSLRARDQETVFGGYDKMKNAPDWGKRQGCVKHKNTERRGNGGNRGKGLNTDRKKSSREGRLNVRRRQRRIKKRIRQQGKGKVGRRLRDFGGGELKGLIGDRRHSFEK